MTTEQLRAIAWASERYGRDVADVTDRQNVQLHWIRIEDVPAIFERIEGAGLTTQEACGDTPRVILGCPLAGVTADEVLDATPAIRAVAERYLGDPAFSNLPRKYKTSISGCAACTARTPRSTTSPSSASIVPTLGPGYDLPVGGGLSTNPMFAQRLGAFVEPERVRRGVGRRDRALPRVRLPPLAQPRAPEVPGQGLGRGAACARCWRREFLDARVARRAGTRAGADRARDHVGMHAQRDGRVSVGFAPRAGRIAGHQLRLVADLADAFGDGRWRATAQQKLVIRGVDPARADELVARAGSSPRITSFCCAVAASCPSPNASARSATSRSWCPATRPSRGAKPTNT